MTFRRGGGVATSTGGAVSVLPALAGLLPFSPSGFGTSAFLPSTFLPSTFLPSAFWPSGLAAFGALAALGSSLALAGFLVFFSSWSAIELYSRTLGDPHLAAIIADLETDACWLAVLGVGDCYIGQV